MSTLLPKTRVRDIAVPKTHVELDDMRRRGYEFVNANYCDADRYPDAVFVLVGGVYKRIVKGPGE